ncbi:MAG: PIG-L family deacetylase [Acidobacteria bacterium]|nr:PIG-L family deacetylase [Acidobacteriota bacterium]
MGSFLIAVCCLALGLTVSAQEQAPAPFAPLPQNTGAAGLKQMLLRLQTTARLMQTTAHPDDEDGGMLTLESRGHGVSVLLMTLTHGEGGQNKMGSNLFDALGVVRTLELTGSDRYYGVEQRFSRVADFGFSKRADETFAKWGGHDVALDDMVRVIRTFRPDVLVARFSGTERDGHGHHQASAILTREAFRAAADPNLFPEQFQEGLQPWQAKKLYMGNVCGFGASTCPDANYNVRLNTGVVDPALGMSYIQFALEGLRHQLSQGAGAWSVEPGDRFTFYKLVDSVLPGDRSAHEKDFFDGVDTTLPGLVSKLGREEEKVAWLKPELTKIAAKISEASSKANKNPAAAVDSLSEVVRGLRAVTERVEKSNLSDVSKNIVLGILREKLAQGDAALGFALNLSVEATAQSTDTSPAALPNEADALTVVSPGQKFYVLVKVHNGAKNSLRIENVALVGPPGWVQTPYKGKAKEVAPGGDFLATIALQVPLQVTYTRPPLHRNDPERDSIYTAEDADHGTLPFPPPLLQAQVQYTLHGEGPSSSALASVPVTATFRDDHGASRTRQLAAGPVFSVALEPGSQVIPEQNGQTSSVRVAVRCNLTGATAGSLRLETPPGWKVEPLQQAVHLQQRGEEQHFQFKVTPASLKEGQVQIRAVLEAGGAQYSEGFSLVTRDDLDSFYYYQPATQRVSIVEVKVPKALKVAYVMGAGDDIPVVLQQLGLDVTLLPAEKLAGEDLSQYGTLVLGIRAYDTQKDVAANTRKLLSFVSNGGTLVVQYNASTGEFNSGHFTPYPLTLSRARVSVEEAPVEVLTPDDSIFHTPNLIGAHDFDGWVQERGLYFASDWDSHYTPLLASHDPGESPQKGGLLRAQYGKGTYIYTGLAFFRQLPAGVPGAVRLYVNLLAAGHTEP